MRIQDAKKIHLKDLLFSLGYEPRQITKGGTELYYISPFRPGETKGSFAISLPKNMYFDHGEGEGGNIIKFCERYWNTDVSGALKELDRLNLISLPAGRLSNARNTSSVSDEVKIIQSHEIRHPALLRYLEERRAGEAYKQFNLQEYHYEVGEKQYFGIGLKNKNGGVAVRSPISKINLGKQGFSYFKLVDSSILSVVEGMFDAVSLVQLKTPDVYGDIVVLNSLSAINDLMSFVEDSHYQLVQLFLDNDEAGDNATDKLKLENEFRYIDMRLEYKKFKDLNEFHLDLKIFR